MSPLLLGNHAGAPETTISPLNSRRNPNDVHNSGDNVGNVIARYRVIHNPRHSLFYYASGVAMASLTTRRNFVPAVLPICSVAEPWFMEISRRPELPTMANSSPLGASA